MTFFYLLVQIDILGKQFWVILGYASYISFADVNYLMTNTLFVVLIADTVTVVLSSD